MKSLLAYLEGSSYKTKSGEVLHSGKEYYSSKNPDATFLLRIENNKVEYRVSQEYSTNRDIWQGSASDRSWFPANGYADLFTDINPRADGRDALR